MNGNYNLSHKLIAYTLLASLFLQGCNNFSNQVTPTVEKQANDTPGSSRQIETTKQLVEQKLAAEGWELINFYEEKDGLKVQAIEKHGNFSMPHDLSIYSAKNMDLEQVYRLSPKEKERLVHIKKAKNGQPGRVLVFKEGLLGGMQEGNQELPQEMFDYILSFLITGGIGADEIIAYRQVNRAFRNIIDHYIAQGRLAIDEEQDYSGATLIPRDSQNPTSLQLTLNSKIIPAFVFRHLIRCVRNLPQQLWPRLPGSNIQMLNLSQNNINNIDPTGFVNALQNTRVNTIDLSHNNITNEWAVTFAQNLPNQVNTLILSNNEIGNGDIGPFIRALQNTQIHTIDLWYNRIHDLGLSDLSAALQATNNNTLRTIYLGQNKITDRDSLVYFAQALQHTNISKIDLGSNGIDGDAAAAFIAALQGTLVDILILRKNAVENNLTQVAQNLQNTGIHTLDLSDNEITRGEALNFLQNLSNNTTLRILNLSQNNISNTNAVSFAQALQNTHIETLDLTRTSINDNWITTLAQNLQNNNTLNTVNLSLNDITIINYLRTTYPQIEWIFATHRPITQFITTTTDSDDSDNALTLSFE